MTCTHGGVFRNVKFGGGGTNEKCPVGSVAVSGSGPEYIQIPLLFEGKGSIRDV